MRSLTATTQSIKAISLEAATTDLSFLVNYTSKNGRLNIGPTEAAGTFDETLTTIIPSPGTDVITDIKDISASNSDNVAHNVVFYFSNGTDFEIFRCLLNPNWSVYWTPENGWKIYTEKGVSAAAQSLTEEKFDNVTAPDVTLVLVDPLTFVVGVFKNGVRLESVTDYSVAGQIVTFVVPLVNDNIVVVYY